tara:strand:- start:2394 stop:3980 length:1587 start_codon:yes stop_codon:yes gene_type:complete
MTKVLITDPIDQAGIDILSQVAQVDQKIGISESDLINIISDYDALMIRSGTQVTGEIINSSNKLRIIGRAGVGVDNVDVRAATQKGVLVVNSPGGNTIAAAEHTIAMMLALSRNIPVAHTSTKAGKWERKKFVGNELFKKQLGVVGLGKIGTHVAKVANALGMNVTGYDPFVSNERAQQMQVRLLDLNTLFEESDYVTLHLPRTSETENLVDLNILRLMKSNSKLINCARGGIIDENALAEALNTSLIGGAAIDVFSEEPLNPDSPLLKVDKNLILTPHLGASTKEAQENVAVDVAEQIKDVLLGLSARTAVNIPGLSPDIMDSLKPHLQLAETLGLLISQLSGGQIKKLELKLQGEFVQHPSKPLIIASLKGILSKALGDRINYVNASLEAESRGINVIEKKDESRPEFASGLLQLTTFGDNGENSVAGSIFADGELRIISIDQYPVNVSPSRFMLLTRHRDMPGIIGKLGSLLGNHNVNIASMQVGRKIVRGEAVMVLSVDDPIPSNLLESILKVDGITSANPVTL